VIVVIIAVGTASQSYNKILNSKFNPESFELRAVQKFLNPQIRDLEVMHSRIRGHFLFCQGCTDENILLSQQIDGLIILSVNQRQLFIGHGCTDKNILLS
jgi:hypothetical protein